MSVPTLPFSDPIRNARRLASTACRPGLSESVLYVLHCEERMAYVAGIQSSSAATIRRRLLLLSLANLLNGYCFNFSQKESFTSGMTAFKMQSSDTSDFIESWSGWPSRHSHWSICKQPSTFGALDWQAALECSFVKWFGKSLRVEMLNGPKRIHYALHINPMSTERIWRHTLSRLDLTSTTPNGTTAKLTSAVPYLADSLCKSLHNRPVACYQQRSASASETNYIIKREYFSMPTLSFKHDISWRRIAI